MPRRLVFGKTELENLDKDASAAVGERMDQLIAGKSSTRSRCAFMKKGKRAKGDSVGGTGIGPPYSA